ncbi:PDZ domain-containing protein 11 isoform X1 [Perca fluviatilis]|uniref:PDZ domain-containing protein 11 isoform X1 n=1 Tax=Perca fluviatilis TaxID=8168 RepID=UPI001963474A|nr:PDZ domain-containing protein 11 isoform X1 [Perca fluviatilis]
MFTPFAYALFFALHCLAHTSRRCATAPSAVTLPDGSQLTALFLETMDQKIPYDDYQLPVVFLPSYENPPAWIAPQERVLHPDYNNELTQFLPRTIVLKKPPGAQLGFNIRGGKASQLGIFISKVVPDSDAHRAGLQEGDQVLSVNEVDFQDIEHSRAVEILKTAREILMRVRFFPYNYQRQKERTVH